MSTLLDQTTTNLSETVKPTPLESFGKQLRKLRGRANMSEGHLARRIEERTPENKVTEQDVKNWELDLSLPERDILHALSVILILEQNLPPTQKLRELESFLEAGEKGMEVESGERFFEMMKKLRARAGLSEKDLAERLEEFSNNPRFIRQGASGKKDAIRRDIELVEEHNASVTAAEAVAIIQGLESGGTKLSTTARAQLLAATNGPAKKLLEGDFEPLPHQPDARGVMNFLMGKHGSLDEAAHAVGTWSKTLYNRVNNPDKISTETKVMRCMVMDHQRDALATLEYMLRQYETGDAANVIDQSLKTIRECKHKFTPVAEGTEMKDFLSKDVQGGLAKVSKDSSVSLKTLYNLGNVEKTNVPADLRSISAQITQGQDPLAVMDFMVRWAQSANTGRGSRGGF